MGFKALFKAKWMTKCGPLKWKWWNHVFYSLIGLVPWARVHKDPLWLWKTDEAAEGKCLHKNGLKKKSRKLYKCVFHHRYTWLSVVRITLVCPTVTRFQYWRFSSPLNSQWLLGPKCRPTCCTNAPPSIIDIQSIMSDFGVWCYGKASKRVNVSRPQWVGYVIK